MSACRFVILPSDVCFHACLKASMKAIISPEVTIGVMSGSYPHRAAAASRTLSTLVLMTLTWKNVFSRFDLSAVIFYIYI